jgi:hypothetical protein
MPTADEHERLVAAVCTDPEEAIELIRWPGMFHATADEQSLLIAAVCTDPNQAAHLLQYPCEFQATDDDRERLVAASNRRLTPSTTDGGNAAVRWVARTQDREERDQ